MRVEERLLERLTKLIGDADAVLATHTPNPPNVVSAWTLNVEVFERWKASARNIILAISGQNSHYGNSFVDQTKQGATKKSVRSGKGILLALKDDVESGLITTTKSLAFAEVFSDFLEIADHLLQQGYKDPGASLIGAVLEDSLRKIALNNAVPVKDSDDIKSLNTKLADKEIYNRLAQKQIQTWNDLRNSADHGKFSEYRAEDVQDMLRGVTRFIAERLG